MSKKQVKNKFKEGEFYFSTFSRKVYLYNGIDFELIANLDADMIYLPREFTAHFHSQNGFLKHMDESLMANFLLIVDYIDQIKQSSREKSELKEVFRMG